MAYINLFIECSRWRLHFLLLQQSEKRSYCWSWKGKVDVCSWALTTMIAFTFLRMFGHLLYKYLKSNMTTNKEINVTIFSITSYSQTKINRMNFFNIWQWKKMINYIDGVPLKYWKVHIHYEVPSKIINKRANKICMKRIFMFPFYDD